MILNAVDQYRQYRAPRVPDTSLIDPDLSAIQAMLALPAEIAGGAELEFCGKNFRQVRAEARQEVVSLASSHTSLYSDPARLSAIDIELRPLVLSGHQPELFHAGVWFKNFLLNRLATNHNAIAINFLVDNDLCRSTAIRVPGRNSDDKVLANQIAFDGVRNAIPWELRSVESPEVWRAFPSAVSRQLGSLAEYNPVLNDLWPKTFEPLKRHGKIGLALAQARHQLEQEEGIQTLEVPLSRIVSTRAFARFSIQLLAELPRFQDVYNTQRALYRKAHRIRSEAHPVPALEQKEGWIEGPWWVYRPDVPHRKRLWVKMIDDQLILSDRAGWQEVIEGRLDCDNAASQWLDLLSDGVCIRPRALLTTMYLRLFVCDLFIHGIGGGKYDQLTNTILHEFFRIEPPPMAVATATLHLPLAARRYRSSEEIEAEIRAEQDLIWRCRYHANRMADDLGAEAKQLAELKQNLLEKVPERSEKWEWHQQMTRLNHRLAELAGGFMQAAKSRVESLTTELRQAQLLESREYSFCLFPRGEVVSQLARLCEP